MAAVDSNVVSKPARSGLGLPREVILITLSSLGLLVAVGCGSLIADHVPQNQPWLFAGAFGGPMALVFAAYWLISRKL